MRAVANPKSSMPKTFDTAFDPKNNGFGLLRLALALLVIFSHSYPLGGFGPDPIEAATNQRHSIGLVAVAMFFVLSGFLICRSAAAAISVPRFLWHRILRIYPAYWVCLVLCAYLFAPLFCLYEYGSFARVFSASADSPRSFVTSNAALFQLNGFSIQGILCFGQHGIEGLLGRNPYPYALNGSLWSLPFEVSCYVAIAALAAMGVIRRGRVVVLAILFALWGLYAFESLNPESFRRCFASPAVQPLVMLCLSFFAGATAYLYREKIPHSLWLLGIAVIALCASLPLGIYGVVAPVAITYAFLWLAFSLPLGWFEKKGDFSYGTYIYAFPVQQGLALLRIHEEGFALFFFSAVLLTLVLAFFSYRLVEAPALRFKGAQLPTWRWHEHTAVAALAPVTPSPAAADAVA